jgi:hypothetical protein
MTLLYLVSKGRKKRNRVDEFQYKSAVTLFLNLC